MLQLPLLLIDGAGDKIESFVVSSQRMLANGYPLPSYIVRSLQSSEASSANETVREEEVARGLKDMQSSMEEVGWIETPEWPSTSDDDREDGPPEIIAVDCEMASSILLASSSHLSQQFNLTVPNFGREGAYSVLFHFVPYRQSTFRYARSAAKRDS